MILTESFRPSMKGTNLPSFRFIPCQRKVALPGHRYLWMEERLYGTGMLIAALQGYPGCVQLFRSIACDSWAQVHVLCETSGEGTGWSRINHSCWSQCLQSAVINSSPRPYSNLLNGDHSLIWYHSLTKAWHRTEEKAAGGLCGCCNVWDRLLPLSNKQVCHLF